MVSAPPYRLLIVEDDPLFARTLRLQLGRGPFSLTFCGHAALALQQMRQSQPDLILLDIHLGGHEEGLTALPKLIAAAPRAPVVVHSVLSDHATVVRAMRQGAHDYIPKHVGIKTLGEQLLHIIEQHQAGTSRGAAEPGAEAPGGMLGHSPAMRALHGRIAQAGRSQGSVIINGEPGSGKELVARAMARPGCPFVAVDASTLEGNLATGMLFGHERGAFTGADTARAGLFEQAHGGVLYFDEIANMTLDVQAKLLRVLQEREVTRLGGTSSRPVSFRLICATHADLPALCRAGRFRFDLLTRLEVFTLEVPPLRERREDIPELFAAFVARFCQELDEPARRIEPRTLQALQALAWPGNVRQLQGAAQFAVAACPPEEMLAPHHLPPALQMPAPTEDAFDPNELEQLMAQGAHPVVEPLPSATGDRDLEHHAPTSFWAQVRAFERRTLLAAYASSQGNISAMARQLGMDRSSLYAKLRLYAIHTTRPV